MVKGVRGGSVMMDEWLGYWVDARWSLREMGVNDGAGSRQWGNGFGEAWFCLWGEGLVKDRSGSFGSEGRSKVGLFLGKKMGVMVARWWCVLDEWKK
ncbi:hypothetical protein V6N12_038699 [Hibiscus sabdariffa]|uniref:Uncharacterized protein n=1 Tax=Hibiscus sabdariffa TaxID=183260 RepID=A0ABR2CAK3_9ROSI